MKYAVRRNPTTGNWIMYRMDRNRCVYRIVGRSSNWRTAMRSL